MPNDTPNARQHFTEASEAALNAQVNAELTASYVYRSMAAYFNRDDVALPGFSKFFQENSEEESGHAQKFIDYINRRGGRVKLCPIVAPKQEWTSALEAMEDCLALEKDVNAKLIALHEVADNCNDYQLCDWIASGFLEEQVEAIYEISQRITKIKRVGEGLGVHMIDQEMSS